MKAKAMSKGEELSAAAASLVTQTIELLTAAQRYQAVPYLKQAVAIIQDLESSSDDAANGVAMGLLRMALVLLDRDGENEAAGDVESALIKLGEPFPELSDLEASARMDWWSSRREARPEAAAE